MPAKRRRSKSKDDSASDAPDRVQMLAVYNVDLMAELEGLLRTLTRTQEQIERLRSGGSGPQLNESQRREALKLLSGNLKAFAAKVETLRETLPEILRTANQLDQSEEAEGSESA